MHKSPYDDRDFLYDQVCIAHPPLPKTFSLKEEMFPVRNQGKQGSCVAQALASIQEYNNQKDILLKGYLSPQFIYDCRPKDISGMTARGAMKFLSKNGVCTEKTYPYKSNMGDYTPPGLKGFSDKIKEEAYVYRIKNYAQCTTVYDAQNALYLNGPLLITVPVYGRPRAIDKDKHKVYAVETDMWRKKNGYEKIGGHAMTIVGWDLNGFVLRNSWGDKWGYRGHCNFSFDDWGRQYDVWSPVDHINSEFKPKKDEECFLSEIKKCLDRKRWR